MKEEMDCMIEPSQKVAKQINISECSRMVLC